LAVASRPTVHIIASDQHRNGKTLLARMLSDYLLLDGRDPFLIDTDAPDAPLRSYFPGRTQLADFATVQGQIKIFDTVLASTGRDYVIDLTARHTSDFFEKARDLSFFAELQKLGYTVVVCFIVDNTMDALKYFTNFKRSFHVALIVPVRNRFVGSMLPDNEDALDMPLLDEETMKAVLYRHFSMREYVLGDQQNLSPEMDIHLKRFVYDVMQGFTELERHLSMNTLKSYTPEK
jgi:hypothetical protein